ncbi:hypothetical protein C2S53_017759 [Perilla frutescens var. hirtella]|uniref:Uncharacterized protein n=1 Tax=Perilla frutescens var. hirtella TaxID=608512 RepID=A0AAD4P1Q5_PERFH|nr:hypothetical protein C2S53_017759 [Perilla frutescens var. hirtella]
MWASRRALLHHLNSSNRYVSISHINQEESLRQQLHKNTGTAEGSETDTGSRKRSTPMNIGNGVTTSMEEERRKSPRKTVEPVEEMMKVAAVGAMETALKLGRIAKHTMDGMWEIAEKTTESVRDSVADDRSRNAGGNDFKYRR